MPERVHTLMGMHTAPLGLQLLRDPRQFSLVREGPITMVCQAMKAGDTEEILTVERLCTGRVELTCFCPLFTFAGYPAAVAESEKVLSPLPYTTALDTSHNPVTRSHHTTVTVCFLGLFGKWEVSHCMQV